MPEEVMFLFRFSASTMGKPQIKTGARGAARICSRSDCLLDLESRMCCIDSSECHISYRSASAACSGYHSKGRGRQLLPGLLFWERQVVEGS